MTDAGPMRALNAVLRDDFCAFVEKCFVHLNPGTSYHDNWHIHVICHYLIRSLKGETNSTGYVVAAQTAEINHCVGSIPGIRSGALPLDEVHLRQLRAGPR